MDKMREEFEAVSAAGQAALSVSGQERGEAALPVAFQFGGHRQYVANHWPPHNVGDMTVSPLYSADTIAALTAELAEVREQRDSLRDEVERLEKDLLTLATIQNGGAVKAADLIAALQNAENIQGKAALSASGREGAAPAIAKQSEGE